MKLANPVPALLAALALAGSLACTTGRAEPVHHARTSVPARGAAAAAEVLGETINLEEVDERAKAKLLPLRQQEYDIRRDILETMIAEKVYEKEAADRGVSVESLLSSEIAARVSPPGESQMRKLFQQSRLARSGQSFDSVRPRIEVALREQARQEAQAELLQELSKKLGVRVLLAAPRVTLEIPETAPVLGPKDAPVTIVEYADYECPYCQRAQVTMEEVLERYRGKVRLVHFDFPLDFHSRAKVAARAAQCAHEQGRFWEFHRAVLMSPGTLSDADLKARAAGVGVKMPAFSECLASDRFNDTIRESVQQALAVGVNSTPTFFINGRQIRGARSVEAFAEIIDEELQGL